jgi:NADPH2:quinone reductase
MTLPAEMRYIAHTCGGPEVLHLATGAVPRPDSGEVLIRVQAAGVNGPDVHQRTGAYPPPPGANPVLGWRWPGKSLTQTNARR